MSEEIANDWLLLERLQHLTQIVLRCSYGICCQRVNRRNCWRICEEIHDFCESVLIGGSDQRRYLVKKLKRRAIVRHSVRHGSISEQDNGGRWCKRLHSMDCR